MSCVYNISYRHICIIQSFNLIGSSTMTSAWRKTQWFGLSILFPNEHYIISVKGERRRCFIYLYICLYLYIYGICNIVFALYAFQFNKMTNIVLAIILGRNSKIAQVLSRVKILSDKTYKPKKREIRRGNVKDNFSIFARILKCARIVCIYYLL